MTLMCGIILAKGEMATASTQSPNSNHHHLVCSLIIKVPAKYIILVGHQQLGEIIEYKIQPPAILVFKYEGDDITRFVLLKFPCNDILSLPSLVLAG